MSIVSDSMGPADIAAITGNNGNNGWGNDGSIWIWVLFLFALMGGWNNNGNNGSYNGYPYPYPMMGNTSAVQSGFDQAAIMNGLSTINSGMSTGFANAEVSRCNGQANVLQALNNNQMGLITQLNNMATTQQTCCCENRAAVADVKYAVANEGALIRSNTDAKVQMVMDKLCQLELDGIRQNYENRISGMQNTIDGLRNDIANARFDASQNAQTGAILADNAAQTRILNPTAVPAYIVPNYNGCNCNQGYYNCGCGA